MHTLLIKNGLLVNEGKEFPGHVLIEQGHIAKIIEEDEVLPPCDHIIDASGKHILPGVIDAHVHFREPGFTPKGDIASESQAAVAGGVTSIMEMPNTNPKTTSLDELEKKIELASSKCLTNFAFYLGASNSNLKEITNAPPDKVCGVKLFMGSSTGDMLVDKKQQLEAIFSESPLLIAAHCEDEQFIQQQTNLIKKEYGETPPFSVHAIIRNENACFRSAQYAVELANKYGSRLHICHLSTEDELSLLEKNKTIREKKITSEVSIHHLYFDADDYDQLGAKIKVNPAIKNAYNRKALFQALINNHIDIIATDHAPHLLSEKQNNYYQTPSGTPMIQHSLIAMLELYHKGLIPLPHIVDKMCHTPAELFQVEKRGYLREGYHADLTIVDLNKSQKIEDNNILYKCGWSAFEGYTFHSCVEYTIINGKIVNNKGDISYADKGQSLIFNR
jgi:dihydroorotase